MGQLTFAEAEYNVKKRKTRREKFLEQMDILIPWKQLERKIQRLLPQKWPRPSTISPERNAASSLHAVVLQS